MKGLQLEPLGQKSERERGRKGWAALGRLCKNKIKSGAVCSMVSFVAEVLADCKKYSGLDRPGTFNLVGSLKLIQSVHRVKWS